MRSDVVLSRLLWKRGALPVLLLATLFQVPSAAAADAAKAGGAADPALVKLGEEIFLREWMPDDPRAARGGDGLGPVYNDTSCVACHGLGGPGGGGPGGPGGGAANNRRVTLGLRFNF